MTFAPCADTRKPPKDHEGLCLACGWADPLCFCGEEDAALNALADERAGGPFVAVSLDDLDTGRTG